MTHARRINKIEERLNESRQEPILLRRITRVVDDCIRLISSDNVPNNTMEYCLSRLKTVQRNLERANGSVLDEDVFLDLRRQLQELIEEVSKGKEETTVDTGYQAERILRSAGGAHRYEITKEQLLFLVQCGFTMSRISELLAVSSKTVQRRMREFGLQCQMDYSHLTDDELDHLVRQLVRGNSLIGPNAVCARLFSQHYKVQRWRVRESMLRIDPGGAAVRIAPSLKRRTYSVAGPNSLWHIDGNHKLIRWKIVIHGGIDGNSRLIVFLHASNSNTKETVLEHFITATARYGIPSRIRVDHGGENNDICRVMELLRGSERGSAIRGRSVHNQRIERNWVDLWNGATNMFYDMFHFMEQSGHLDVNNDSHIWALHYVFIPRLNRELNDFVKQWNNHGLRTERHQTPTQLFVGRSLELCNAQLTAMDDMFGSTNRQVTEADQSLAVFHEVAWDSLKCVKVPGVACPLNTEAFQMLKGSINPLDGNDQLGINLYLNVVDFIQSNA